MQSSRTTRGVRAVALTEAAQGALVKGLALAINLLIVAYMGGVLWYNSESQEPANEPQISTH